MACGCPAELSACEDDLANANANYSGRGAPSDQARSGTCIHRTSALLFTDSILFKLSEQRLGVEKDSFWISFSGLGVADLKSVIGLENAHE